VKDPCGQGATMHDYQLERLDTRSFEQLIQALGTEIIGPCQGKTTLGQYACQLLRAELLRATGGTS